MDCYGWGQDPNYPYRVPRLEFWYRVPQIDLNHILVMISAPTSTFYLVVSACPLRLMGCVSPPAGASLVQDGWATAGKSLLLASAHRLRASIVYSL